MVIVGKSVLIPKWELYNLGSIMCRAFSLNLVLNPNPIHDREMETHRQQVREYLPTVSMLSLPVQEPGHWLPNEMKIECPN